MINAYIQVTNRCNLSCPHCCFSCTSTGEDMALGDYIDTLDALRILKFTEITIGGGEPTLHKDFEQLVLSAIARDFRVHVVTNGTDLARCQWLIDKSSRLDRGILLVELSTDPWHPKNPNAERLFALAGIPERKAIDVLCAQGRAKDIPEAEDYCAGEGVLVRPNMMVQACNCADAPIVCAVDDLRAMGKLLWALYELGNYCGRGLSTEVCRMELEL